MFVFKEELITAEHCGGQCDDYYREYRSPRDYGHECNQEHKKGRRHETKHDYKHEYKNEYKHHMPPELKLAEAYVPFQKWECDIYPSTEGLKKGTIFPQLYRPYEKKNCGCRYQQTELMGTKTDVEIEK